MEMINILQDLTAAFGPSGCEKDVRERIASISAPISESQETDAMGNLVVHLAGKGRKLLFEAHMDTIGVIITHIDPNGFLRFGAIGGLETQDIRQQEVVFQNGIRGVISVSDDKEEVNDVKLSDLFIDIGAENIKAAKKIVNIGDIAVFDTSIWEQNGKVFSRYLDNRSGCAALLRAMELISNPQNDLYFAFTTQEELGLRGVQPAVYSVNPDVGISVDVTFSDDLPGSTHNCSVVLGQGPGVKLLDDRVICQSEVVNWIDCVAEKYDISVQHDILRGGGTNAGVIQPSRNGVWTGGLCIPCRYAHAPIGICDLDDIENTARLIASLAESEFPPVAL